MVELPKTEAELQVYVNEQIQAKQTEWETKKNDDFAKQRTKHEEEIKKLKESIGKSADELAQERIKEQQEKDAQELADLRAFRKTSIISEKLSKEGLPNFFKNDNRLLSAEEGDYDKVIKDIKKEYEAVLPKGNVHSTVVQTNAGGPANKDDKSAMFAKVGEALKEAIG